MEKARPEVTLNVETKLPVTGLGTYGIWTNAGANAVSSGINAGYRLIDTAYNYENVGAVEEGIKRSGISREELWITSKLPGRYHNYEKALVAILESLYRSKLSHFSGKETILNDFNYKLQLHIKDTLSFEYMVPRDRVLLFLQKLELSGDVPLIEKHLQELSKFMNK